MRETGKTNRIRGKDFFARYLGKECTLEQVVDSCNTDTEGYTTLTDLVRACEELDLEPLAIECRASDVLSLGDFCVRAFTNSTTLIDVVAGDTGIANISFHSKIPSIRRDRSSK